MGDEASGEKGGEKEYRDQQGERRLFRREGGLPLQISPSKKNEAIASFFFIQAAGLAYH